MMSAFGIEHISKTLVPGHGHVKATELTPGMKKIVQNRLSSKVWAPGKKVEGRSAKGRQIYDDEPQGDVRSLKRKIRTDVLPDKPHPNLHPIGTQLLGASRPNGRGGGVIRMNPKAADQAATYKHEMAHIQPKRNPVRFFERVNSSEKKLGREEGRADFTANQKRTPHSYPGGREFQRGYDQVQRKMQTGRKSKKFAVDSKGTAVQKSAFGVTL